MERDAVVEMVARRWGELSGRQLEKRRVSVSGLGEGGNVEAIITM